MDADWEKRAEARRARMTIRKTRLGAPDADEPLRGEAALALSTQLLRDGWALSGQPWPSYARSAIPVRFVRRAP